MTCVVGYVEDGRVHLGGDSAGVSGWDITLRADPKVFRVGEFVIGFTTSFRMGQLLQHSFEPPTIPPKVDLFQYMVTDFIGEIRSVFDDGGFSKEKDGRESGGIFLVGIRGRLFKVCDDYQVGESLDGYDACGCGEAYALGSLHTNRADDARGRLFTALMAASHHSAGVAAPFVFVSTNT